MTCEVLLQFPFLVLLIVQAFKNKVSLTGSRYLVTSDLTPSYNQILSFRISVQNHEV